MSTGQLNRSTHKPFLNRELEKVDLNLEVDLEGSGGNYEYIFEEAETPNTPAEAK